MILDKLFPCWLSSGKWKFGHVAVMHPSQNGCFINDCSFTLHFVWTGPAAMVTENHLVLCPCHFHGKSQLLGWVAAMRDNNQGPEAAGPAHCLAGHQLEQGGTEPPRVRGQLRMAPELPKSLVPSATALCSHHHGNHLETNRKCQSQEAEKEQEKGPSARVRRYSCNMRPPKRVFPS